MLVQLWRMEWRLLLRSGVFWIVALVFGALGFGLMASDNVSFGGGVGNVMRNAPAVTVVLLTALSLFSALLTTLFVGGIAIRDFELGTAELFFATPIRKSLYLAGRFGGGFLASFVIMLVMVLGLWLGSKMPWLDASRLGPTPWLAYAWSVLLMVVPNLMFLSALLFALATATRSMLYTYLGVIGFFVLWTISNSLMADLQTRWIAALLDPSGGSAIDLQMKYWSSQQLNTQLPRLDGLLLANRGLWLGIALLLLWASYGLFRIDREGLKLPWRRGRRAGSAVVDEQVATAGMPEVVLREDGRARWVQYLHLAGVDLRHALLGAPLLVLLVLALLVLYFSFSSGNLMYGTDVYPVTARMQSMMSGSISLMLIIVLTFYAGELVWRDRSARLAEVTDAYPTPDWLPLASKLTALAGIVVAFHLAALLFAVGYQLAHGYVHLQPLLYLQSLLLDLLPYLLIAVLAVFLQVVSGNKFSGYLLMVIYLAVRIALPMMHYDHLLYSFGKASPTPYSDMNGWGHFVVPSLWFRAYWGALCIVLLALAAALWPRGSQLDWTARRAQLKARLHGPLRGLVLAGLLLFVGLGGWIFYNTNVLNRYVSSDKGKQEAAAYEKAFRQYKDRPQPTLHALTTRVDIYPATRSVHIEGSYHMRNDSGQPISQLYVTIEPTAKLGRLDFPAHSLLKSDPHSGFRIYQLAQPLAPGAGMDMAFTLDFVPHGFEMDAGDTALVHNGSFINNMQVLPQFGYDTNRQLTDRNDRRKYGLPDVPRANPIDDKAAWSDNYLGPDHGWVDFDTTVSTSADQIALAPGYLQRDWVQDGRHYYHYRSEAPVLAFFSWLSARWKVQRDHWNQVAIEVYYDPQHPYNVGRMIEASKEALDYYSRNFSPYQFRQLRILEFPGYSSFAQSFANTVPFSEAIGFIADLRDSSKIDYPFYVTAHEVAHQWWAHQVIGANVQGSTMLSESLAQYSALMVMKHHYGPQKMRKFLKYELDRYLGSRATERVAEEPLALNENQQYIHYAKGSVVFYALQDTIGEDTLNKVLAQFLREHAFKGAPYPTTRDFMADLYAGTDARYHPFIRDLFERIVFWDNRAVKATAVKRADGKYELTLVLKSLKHVADGKGKVTDEPMDEWVDVGVFAKAADGKEENQKVLYLQKQHITSADTTVKLVLDEAPYEAGIDPYNKLVDTDSDDNRVKVVIH
ncbi:ABC transporter permease/M1 family aminopeptidase [Frateuria aurantia]